MPRSEKLFKEAREHYTYRQDIKVQTRDGNTVTGEYHEVFDVLYDDKGHRIENVVFAPQSSLEQGGLSLDEGDVQDFRNRLPFVLTTDEIPEYNILYVGQQRKISCTAMFLTSLPSRLLARNGIFRDASGWTITTPDRQDLRPSRSGNPRHEEEG